LNSSKKLRASSKRAIGESNHQRFTIVGKVGKMKRATVDAAHHADPSKPNAASALGT
jgi:hypothetical protein